MTSTRLDLDVDPGSSHSAFPTPRLRIIHVVPAVTEEASGPSYSVPRLCEALIEQGHDVTLAALQWSPARELPYLKTFPTGNSWRRLGRSPALHDWLGKQAVRDESVIIHNHGMWQMNSLYPGWVARRTGARLIVSPRGAFSQWAMTHGSPAKKLFWPMLQRPALVDAVCFHATSDLEYQDIRRLGFNQPVTIIPNGIDVPAQAAIHDSDGQQRIVLFLGRIHAKKGLDMLLAAWASVQQRFPQWSLRIVGSDTGYDSRSGRGYLDKMRVLARTIGAERVDFAGELVGQRKWEAYREAHLFVLPTYSENFGMSVAEALSIGVPAIVTEGAPWQGLNTHGAGWWVGVSQDAIASALQNAMARPTQDLLAMGASGREWMLREFEWDAIGQKMSMTYQWLAGKLERAPDWIRTD